MQLFNNRKLIIATKHGKEKEIAPMLEKALGVSCVVADRFDTDELGTFTGEINRKYDPKTTVRLKCERALEIMSADLAVASEGSFGAHPHTPFIHANEELIMLVDKKNNLEVVGHQLSVDTNFNGRYVNNYSELEEFAQQARFPSHGLILKNHEEIFDKVIKDFEDWIDLKKAYRKLEKYSEKIFVETDMRAMNNPMRMAVIKKATEDLIKNLKSCCSKCRMPGFSIQRIIRGLPCRMCGQPTDSVKKLVYRCNACDFEEILPIPEKLHEEPMYCNYCNP